MLSNRPFWVVVPARDERERIAACLDALQIAAERRLVTAVVVADSCRDGTADVVRRWASEAGLPVVLLEVTEGSAGGARRAGMEYAAWAAPDDAILATTDADSRVAADWLERTEAEMSRGAAAVAGMIRFDPAELAAAAPCPVRRLEGRYAALQAEITARADPQPHDPWPNHLWAWGASLAVRADVYRDVGGMPPIPLAEDRAFVDLLERRDVRVRRSLEVRVTTSARIAGRAPGGLAHLVDRYRGGEDAGPCDAALEPAETARLRATLKARLRRSHTGTEPFGEAWARLEALRPDLARRRLFPGDLTREMAKAEAILSHLRGPAGPDDTAAADAAALWSPTAPPL